MKAHRFRVSVAFLIVLTAAGGCGPSEGEADRDWSHWMTDSQQHGPMMDAMMHDSAFMDQWTDRVAEDPDTMQQMMGRMMQDDETMSIMMDEMASDPRLREAMLRHMRDNRDHWNDILLDLAKDPQWCREMTARCSEATPAGD